MDDEFVEEVRKALELARKLRYEELGSLPRLRRLKLVENCMLSSPDRSDVYFGKAIMSLLWEVVDCMKPDFPEDLNNPRWRLYIILRDHSKRGEEWLTVAERLGLRGAAFQDAKRQAGQAVAGSIWAREEETRLALVPKDNLPPATLYFDKYIERYNQCGDRPIVPGYEETQTLAEIVIEQLKGRASIIALEGAPGVGKTSLAYEVGRRCRDRGLFEAIIWTSAKKRTLMLEAPSFSLVPFIEPVSSCEDVLDTIAHELEYRAVSVPNGYSAKLRTVTNLLGTRNCLIIIDNLEDFTMEARGQLAVFLRVYRGVSKVILTSRVLTGVGDWPIDLGGMSWAEASTLVELTCQDMHLPSLEEEERQRLYKATEGNPLAIRNVLALMRMKGYALDVAVAEFQVDPEVAEYLWGPLYRLLDDTGEGAKRVLHIMPVFQTYSVSDEAIRAASRLDSSPFASSLGALYNLNFVTKHDSRYVLHLSAYRFLETRGEVTVNGAPLTEMTARAYAGLAQYYTRVLAEKGSMDQRLRFVAQGQGDEKWIIMRTLDGCRQLADFNLPYEGCRPHDAWTYIVDLFDLMGHVLGILWYPEERLSWAEQACIACRMLGLDKKELWFKAFDIGWMSLKLKEEEKAERIFTETLAEAKDKGYKEVQALALRNLGRMASERGDLNEACDLLMQSLGLWLECEPEYSQWIAYTKSALGLTKYRQAQTPQAKDKKAKLLEARTLLDESLDLREKTGNLDEMIEALSETALPYAALGMLSEALRRSDEATRMARQIRPPSSTLAYTLLLRSEIEELMGRNDAAMKCVEEAQAIYGNLGAKYRLSIAEARKEHLESLGESSKTKE